ncbi:HAD-IIB family hydrolase [Amphritea sp. 1_MG-2023]|uniref:HAD-IIB family hydrolase n=1 Tax=Amphritea sp. 1_MG-2023 TaxID=3062670 RepID=UPI0026E25CA9|nr:HAD-IIB family hydrolase [Amphritea sp. 1_MG-2023]MDO6562004.1 HAD-IIB family hydrolase [Amphritea sp. 1_MG-2023]
MRAKILVFTDLDGSLLDHYTYRFDQAKPLLALLKQTHVPVIPVTSKTRAELSVLRGELDSDEPFIVENGAAVFMPAEYFDVPPSECIEVDGFYCAQFSKPRDYWLDLLAQQSDEFEGEFETFTALGVDGICASTGLSAEAARLANTREFSEPVKWRGSEQRKSLFVARLRAAGATVLQGGRFLHVTGACNKGKALQWLYQQYQSVTSSLMEERRCLTIAVGDGENDVDMLQVANCAVIIRSPVHEPPVIEHNNIYRTQQTGPEGWVEGVSWFLGASERPIEMNLIEYLRKKLRSHVNG